MDVSAAAWNAVSKLLDEALDLEPAARAAWLERLGRTRPQLAPLVRKLLAAHASAETGEALEHLPPLVTASGGAPAAAGPASLDRVGPYRLLRELGHGGMADVWLAERADGAFVRTVALKLPRVARMRPELAERFALERDILARLEHPNIARLYDAGIDASGLPYLAMEFVDGRPITRYCDEERLDIRARIRLFDQVLQAVQYAHANLVIHRDLKPSNILVTGPGQVRLLDFGIAKLLAGDDPAPESQLTRLGGRALTPEYASPEQIHGALLTIATDVYSLGVVLYEILTGGRPYRLKLESAAQLEQAIVAADPVRPSANVADRDAAAARATTPAALARRLAGDLDTIVLTALAKAPAQRYPSVAALAEDLQRSLAAEPLRARRATWTYRLGRFVLRHRLAVAAGGAITLALVGAVGASSWQARVASEQAQRAREVKRFVLSIFEDADTYAEAGASRKTTAADLLHQARERLASSQLADPAIRVELLVSLGSSLIGLGEHKEAADVLAEATRLAETQLGGDHAEADYARVQYGGALTLTGAFEKAAPLLDAAELGMRRRRDAPGLIRALNWKAFLRAHLGRFDESIALASEAVRVAQAQGASLDRRVLLDATLTLAGAMGAGQRAGRIEPARRAYELAREIHGDRPRVPVLHARSLYALALIEEGDSSLGVAELEALLAQQVELLGRDHLEVKESHARIGNAAMARGDPLRAIGEFTEVLRIELLAAGGHDTAGVGLQRTRLANAQIGARRFGAAESELREANRIFITTVAPEHPDRRRAAAALGYVLTVTGRLDEAQAVFDGLLVRPLGESADDFSVRLRLGTLRSAQGRHDEALALLQAATDFFSRQDKLNAHARALAALGAAQLAAAQRASAEATLRRAQELFASQQPDRSPDDAEVLVDLARALLALGRTQDAVAAAGEAAAFWSRFDPANRSAGLAHLWHARALLAQARVEPAGAELARAAAVLDKSALAADRALLAQTRRELGARRLAHT